MMMTDKYFKNENEGQSSNENKERLKVTYLEFGKQCSIDAKGRLKDYLERLVTILSGHVMDQEDIKTNENEKIKPLQDDINRLTDQITNLEKRQDKIIDEEINDIKSDVCEKEKEREGLEMADPDEHLRREGKLPFNLKKYNFLKFFILSLTLTIIYFYANVAWVNWSLSDLLTEEMAYNGCSPGVFNSFSELVGLGPCAASSGFSSIALPLLFLTFSFLIHLLFSSELKNKILYSGFIVFIVLILDIILAVKFEMKIEMMSGVFDPYNPAPTGFINKLQHVASGDNFSLILSLGFFSYLFWSILLYFYEEEDKLRDPHIALNRDIGHLSRQIDQLKNNIETLKNEKRNLIPAEMIEKRENILDLKNKIRIIEIGGYDVLKKRLSEFTIGWNECVALIYSNDQNQMQAKIDEVISAKEQFLLDNLPKQ
jgi:cell division protein FtsB